MLRRLFAAALAALTLIAAPAALAQSEMGPGGTAPPLGASGVAPGTYGSNTQTPKISVDIHGRVTSATQVPSPAVSGEVLIQSQTLSAASASVSFTNIPQGYQDLVLVALVRSDAAAVSVFPLIRFNSDSGSHYQFQYMGGTGSSTSAGNFFSQGDIGPQFAPAASAPANMFGYFETTVTNYASTSQDKQATVIGGSSDGTAGSTTTTQVTHGMWLSTAAVNEVDFIAGSGNWVAGSTFQLYGRGGGNVTVNPQPGLPVICEVVTSGSASSVTIGGGSGACPTLPPTFRDLMVVVSGRSNAAVQSDPVVLQFNGDTGSNYRYQAMLEAGTGANSGAQSASANGALIGWIAGASGVANDSGQIRTNIANYANTLFYKTAASQTAVRNADSVSNLYTITNSNWWNNQAAITSIKVFLNSAGTFTDGTVITVYGIGGTPTATTPLRAPETRLTLTSGAPVMTASATAQGTIYLDNYTGCLVPVGGIMYCVGELSDVLNATAHLSGNLYDVFAYNNSGAIALCTGPAWSSSTARSAAISQVNGIWVNSASLTCTISGGSTTTTIAAGQASYEGSFYATANGQTGMQFNPSPAAGGANSIQALFNAYNQRSQTVQSGDNSTSWTYNSTTWRSSDNSNSNRVTWLDGLAQSSVDVNFSVIIGNAGIAGDAGIDEDATSGAPSTSACSTGQHNPGSGSYATVSARCSFTPLLGLHFAQAMEATASASAVTFIGAQTGPPVTQWHMIRATIANYLPLCVGFGFRRRRAANDNAPRRLAA